MADETTCGICGSEALEALVTYKHIWTQCHDCGNTVRTRRARYPLSSPLFARTLRAVSAVTGGRLKFAERDLLRDEQVVESEDRYYAYYARVLAAGDADRKWTGECDAVMRDLAALGVECRNKSVLDISGGPGLFAREIAKTAEYTLVTEFSADAASAMRKYLGVNAAKFDYNSDSLAALGSRKFDIVFIRHSINFCRDLERFLTDLGAVLNPNAVVYVEFVAPSLGCALTWQFDEYTYERLYQSETLRRFFADAGLHLVAEPRWRKYNPYTHYGSGGRHDPDGRYVPPPNLGSRLYANLQYLCRTPFWLRYGAAAFRPTSNFNRELVQKPCRHVYRWAPARTCSSRQIEGETPAAFLNARLNAASEP